MVLGALGCINMRILGKIVNDNIVLDVFIICQKLRHVQVILKNTELVERINLRRGNCLGTKMSSCKHSFVFLSGIAIW
jgi:hypothetical protein